MKKDYSTIDYSIKNPLNMELKDKRYCPICGTDNTIPKCSLILFLLLVSFIIVTFASFNNDDLHSIILMLLVLIGIFIPLAIIESEKRSCNNSKRTFGKMGLL